MGADMEAVRTLDSPALRNAFSKSAYASKIKMPTIGGKLSTERHDNVGGTC